MENSKEKDCYNIDDTRSYCLIVKIQKYPYLNMTTSGDTPHSLKSRGSGGPA